MPLARWLRLRLRQLGAWDWALAVALVIEVE